MTARSSDPAVSPAAWLLPMIWRQKAKIVGVALVAMVAAILGEALTEPVYQASAALLVRFGHEYLYRPEIGDAGTWSPANLDGAINTEVQILAARDLKARVLHDLGIATVYPEIDPAVHPRAHGLRGFFDLLRSAAGLPARGPTPPEDQALAKFDADLVVTAVKDTNVIILTYRNQDPAVATRVLQHLLADAIDKRKALFGTVGASPLEAQLAAYGRDLQTAEADLQQFQRTNQLYDAEAQATKLDQTSIDLETALAAAADRLAKLRSAQAAIEARMRALVGDETLFSDREPEALRVLEQRLVDERLAEARLLQVMPDTARIFALLHAEEERLKADIEQQRSASLGRLAEADRATFQDLAQDRYDLGVEMAQTTARRDADESQRTDLRDRLARLAARKATLQDLENRVATARTIQENLATRLAELQAAAALDRDGASNLRIIEAPAAKATPIGLQPVAKIVIAGFLGLLAGIGVGAWADGRRPARQAAGGALAAIDQARPVAGPPGHGRS